MTWTWTHSGTRAEAEGSQGRYRVRMEVRFSRHSRGYWFRAWASRPDGHSLASYEVGIPEGPYPGRRQAKAATEEHVRRLIDYDRQHGLPIPPPPTEAQVRAWWAALDKVTSQVETVLGNVEQLGNRGRLCVVRHNLEQSRLLLREIAAERDAPGSPSAPPRLTVERGGLAQAVGLLTEEALLALDG